MKTTAGPLRAARDAVIPQIPELASRLPYIFGNRGIIRRALTDNLEQQGIDPSSIHRRNLNKAERHSIVGFGIREQIAFLVEGSGREARFRQFGTGLPKVSEQDFNRDLLATLDIGASHVEQLYSQGRSPEYSWWGKASLHYKWLGSKVLMSNSHEASKESLGLHEGLRSRAIVNSVGFLLSRAKGVSDQKKERLTAAHDASILLTSAASMHVLRLNVAVLPKSMILLKNERTGIYTPSFPNEGDRARMFPRRSDLLTDTLKCPAHTSIEIPEGLPEAAATEMIGETSLRNLIHATINEAPKYDLI